MLPHVKSWPAYKPKLPGLVSYKPPGLLTLKFHYKIPMSHTPETLVQLFNQTFIPSHNTQLICCEEEPIYRPADAQHPHHRIIFAHGFFASALHEIAHWCVAGKERRLLEDFGYWYEPDGRSAERQAEFEKVEVKPQALEWIFSQSAGFTFHFSADNISLNNQPSPSFQQAVYNQVQSYLNNGLPNRATTWSQTLLAHYRPGELLQLGEFIKPNIIDNTTENAIQNA
ncbi:MAG: elongation factor P hydroxylase [Thiomicrorhabdus sp.]|nr:elongation factor P hydroxylase [Thiomicrorhabdus sp.]